MNSNQDNYLTKLKHALPWLVQYPIGRAKTILTQNLFEKKHIIFTVANHFEPAWKPGGVHDLDGQLRRLDEWHEMARQTGEAVIDAEDRSKTEHQANDDGNNPIDNFIFFHD